MKLWKIGDFLVQGLSKKNHNAGSMSEIKNWWWNQMHILALNYVKLLEILGQLEWNLTQMAA